MAISDMDIRRIGAFARFGAKAPTTETIIAKAFETLRSVAKTGTLRIVYQLGHSTWTEWTSSGRSIAARQHDEWPAPAAKGLTSYFDPAGDRSGYITVQTRSMAARTRFFLEAMAPVIWTALLLEAGLKRAQRAAGSEMPIVRESMRARDEERQRLSRELHDDLGQSLASLKLSLKWAEDIAREKQLPDLVNELSASRDSVSGMLNKIRDLSHTLYPRILDTLGLFAAIKELSIQIARNSKMNVTCAIAGSERSVGKNVGVALYRCCQEAISNAIRHAEASRISIEVTYSDGETGVSVEDNGKGFNPRTLYNANGKMMSSGFWTIRQRMQALNGAFRVSTAEGQGTVVEMMVPQSKSSRGRDAKRKNQTAHR